MILQVPDQHILAEIFQSAPTSKSIPRDGLWFYERTDATGITLRLSFHIFECSIQITLMLGDRNLQTISLEGATQLLDVRDYKLPDGQQMALRGEFQYPNADGLLEIYLEPHISIRLSILEISR